MALYSKKEFAGILKITTRELSVYIKRSKILLSGDSIDDSLDVNKSFLDKKNSKSKAPVAVTVKLNESKPVSGLITEEQIESILNSGIPTLLESERLLKYLDTEKRKRENEKLDIDIAKKKGEVIPSELVKPVFLQHNQSIVTEFKNAADEIVRLFAKKKSLSVNEIAEITGSLISCINTSINKATLLSVNAVDLIINDFSEKKGVGERNG